MLKPSYQTISSKGRRFEVLNHQQVIITWNMKEVDGKM